MSLLVLSILLVVLVNKKEQTPIMSSTSYGVTSVPPPPPPPGPSGYPPVGGAPTVPGGGGSAQDSYFTESRKGEISELRNLLRNFSTERDPMRKRDIMKKVIAYMTLGIDVSRLFTEMMLAIETRDLVIKKMVYLYLTNYARTHPELAQMCTNTLQKDCGNEDPMVRGLALRALCGLNLPQMIEYICDPLRRGLTDGHAYVRKTAVMGVLKLYHLDAEIFDNFGFTDQLYDMLRDPDASVVANCIIVLNEVMQKTPAGGMAINRAIMLHLLNRIHEFNEFAKVQILELVPRYIPANEEEGYQIMNLLDPLLRSADSGATMATMKAFLSLVEHLNVPNDPSTDLTRQIVDRVKGPLVTQISSGSSEIMYVLLKHVQILQDICPGAFDEDYRQFYVRYNEPTHVKYLKISILPRLANSNTAPDIVSELAEMVYDINPKIGRLAVRSMGKIACHGQGGSGAAEAIARRLVEMLDLMSLEHISSEAASSLTLMIRKLPSLKTLISPPLIRSLKYMNDSKGKASLIYLLGECGELIRNAPYAIEKFIDSYDSIKDPVVKIALLTSTMKLFLLRPPEVQKMFGKLLKYATNDVSSQDLHDRALLYYRLLIKACNDPRKMLDGTLKNISDTIDPSIKFAEEQDSDFINQLMTEFNTLAILYGKPSTNFIAPEFQYTYKKMPEEHPLDPTISSHPPTPLVVSQGPPPSSDMYDDIMTTTHPTTAATPAAISSLLDGGGEVDLLGFGTSPTNAPSTAPAAASSSLTLNMTVTMSGDTYQSMWSQIADADAIVSTAMINSMPLNTDIVERKLAKYGIITMASGELPTEFKFFLYAQDSAKVMTFLIQSNIEKNDEPLMILTVKVHGTDKAGTGANVEKLTDIVMKALN